MNYIELINWFWVCDETMDFTPIETRLYFYLLKVANNLRWKQNPFWHSDEKTCLGAKCSRNSMRSARKKLEAAGLIKTEMGGKGYGNKYTYQILVPNFESKNKLNLDPNLAPIGQGLGIRGQNMSLNLPPITKENFNNNILLRNAVSLETTPHPKLGSFKNRKVKVPPPSAVEPPLLEEVVQYAKIVFSERNIKFNEEYVACFYNHYTSLGWITPNGFNFAYKWKSHFEKWLDNALGNKLPRNQFSFEVEKATTYQPL